ncbi:IS21 family transposase [Sandaracinus amylolyticus]
MVEPEVVRQIRGLGELGWGAKRIAQELGVARNTVRRYLRGGAAAEVQVRPGARVLDEDGRAEARQLFATMAAGNAVVVTRELQRRGLVASVRTVQRAVADERSRQRAEELATVRYETSPGHQMQIDFGQKRVLIAGVEAVVHLLVCVLSYSRRIFVRAFLAERGDDWREGVASAFQHFGGVPMKLLIDNARPLVLRRDEGVVELHPEFAAFCRDWDVQAVACAPYRARTKGKTESGVKYVKRNAIAGRSFTSFAALEQHLAEWMREADERVHGTTHEKPSQRFARDEAECLRPLPARPIPSRHQRLERRVANDCFVDVDTVRYSVPHRLVRERVQVHVGDEHVRIYRGAELVATHRRSRAPHTIVRDPAHFDGLIRAASSTTREPDAAPPPANVETFGRSLESYAACIEEVAS